MRVALPAWRLLAPRGGVGNYLFHLVDQYRRLAPDDTFTVYHDGEQADLPAGGNVAVVPLAVPLRPTFVTWNDWALPRAARRAGCDLLHNPNYTLPRGWRGPAVVTVHDVSYARHPEWFAPRIRRHLTAGTRRAVERAVIITDSEFSRQELVALCGADPARVHVVPLAAEPRYRPVVDVGEVRRRYDLPARFVLYLGGVLRRRRLDALVRACARALPADAALVVAGPTQGEELDAVGEAARCGLGDRFRRLGYVPDADLPALYSAATCFAWPSVYEGFGLPPLEALACGTPTVVADASSLPEVVGDAALRVPPDDEEALATTLERVLSDEALQADLRRRGPAQAARFGWTATAQQTLAIYRTAWEQGR